MIAKYILWLISVLIPTFIYAQTDSCYSRLLKKLDTELPSHYYSKDLANRIMDTIGVRFNNQFYRKARTLDEFCYMVTQDLRKLSDDQHLLICAPVKGCDRTAITKLNNFPIIEEYYPRKYLLQEFETIAILPGNVGYLDFRKFVAPGIKTKHRDGFIRAFDFLQKVDVLIIDMRKNSGGDSKRIQDFYAYFSDRQGDYIYTDKAVFRYDSNGKEVEHIFIEEMRSKKSRLGNVFQKVYILTGGRTFSSAELATYAIKKIHPNVVIVGEKTMGGTSGHDGLRKRDLYDAIIPFSISYDRDEAKIVAKGGINPDILTCADSALQVAYTLAIKGKTVKRKEKTRYLKKPLKTAVEYKDVSISDYLGDFLKASFVVKESYLYLNYDNYSERLLVPIEGDKFKCENFEYVKFERDTQGKVLSVEIKQSYGLIEKFYKRSK